VGLKAPKPLEAEKELFFLCHSLCVTLSGEPLAEPRLRCSIESPEP
jgi:hypothetical protein